MKRYQVKYRKEALISGSDFGERTMTFGTIGAAKVFIDVCCDKAMDVELTEIEV